MATIRITDLKLRTIIGIEDWEREEKQDVVINVTMDFDAEKAVKSDDITDTIDYKVITKRIIKEVEASQFFLLEKLTGMVLNIVMENPDVQKATVRIDKPFALRFADSVSIELTKDRTRNKAVIGLGSNIEPEANIAKARMLLKERFSVLRESQFITTKPIGYTDQADFINGSVFIETDLSFEALNQALKEIEKDMGREAADFKFGPRTIDMDIVVFNGEVKDKDFYDRDFLKDSCLELVPDLKY